ncbi:MAG: GNAT family N-acetyltransferase [Chloroflexi bacterium]|nr:MAG: GNAT family N-acetyltransferase [Chloroflexota bacterium]
MIRRSPTSRSPSPPSMPGIAWRSGFGWCQAGTRSADYQSRPPQRNKTPWTEPPRNVTIEIRPATLEDEEAACYLREQLFEPPGSMPPGYTRERFSAAFRWAVEQTNADVLLAFDGDAAVGLTSVYADIQSLGFGPKCWLQDMVVDKERRSQGIGALMMAVAESWAREHGLTHIELSSNAGRADAHRFYERHGFGRANAYLKWLG